MIWTKVALALEGLIKPTSADPITVALKSAKRKSIEVPLIMSIATFSCSVSPPGNERKQESEFFLLFNIPQF